MPAGKTGITFQQFLHRRGYHCLSSGEILIRMIKKSFSEKSFCRFWRMWNPLTGYLFYLIYSFLGGNEKRPYLIIIVFIVSGLVVHDFLIFLLTGSMCIIFTSTFTIYSIIFIIEERIAARKKHLPPYQRQLAPIPIHFFVLLNMVLLSLPLILGILINYFVFPESPVNHLLR